MKALLVLLLLATATAAAPASVENDETSYSDPSDLSDDAVAGFVKKILAGDVIVNVKDADLLDDLNGYLREIANNEGQCKENEEFNACGSACPPTCSNRDQQVCTKQCVSGCFCKKGFVRSEGGQCVQQDKCPQVQCKENEEFNDCGSACPATCSNFDQQRICTLQCVSGCFCREGFVRSVEGNCVQLEKCPQKCEVNEQYYPDGVPSCKNTCQYFNKPGVRCAFGPPGCFCKEGLVQNKYGECVKSEECEPPTEECRGDEEYYSCMPSCNTCDRELKGYQCKVFCMPGCFCREGLVKDVDGKCVSPEQCYNEECRPDEQYYTCKPSCRNTCENYNKNVVCPAICDPGCFCEEGLVRTKEGYCVEPDFCPKVCQYPEFFSTCVNPCNSCEVKGQCNFLVCNSGCDCIKGYYRNAEGICIPEVLCFVDDYFDGTQDVTDETDYDDDDAGYEYDDTGYEYYEADDEYDDKGYEYDDDTYEYDDKGYEYDDDAYEYDEKDYEFNDKGYEYDKSGNEYDDLGDEYDETEYEYAKAGDGYVKTENDSGETRDGSGETRDDSGEARDDSGETRDDSSETRDDSSETRDDSGETRDDSGETRDDSGETRDDIDGTDDNSDDTSKEYDTLIDYFIQSVIEMISEAAPDDEDQSSHGSGFAGAFVNYAELDFDTLLDLAIKTLNEIVSETSEDKSETSEDSSETSKDSNETSKDSSETSKDSSETSKDSSKTSKDSSETSKDSSETSKDSSETSKDSSETSKDSSETSKDSSETSKDSSETSKDSSETSKDSSETSKDSSETSKDSNETSDKCPKNETFSECGSACPTTCSNRGEQQVCTAQCVSGCFCKEGLVRLDGGECVKPDECPKDQCQKNETFNECGSACPATCSNRNEQQVCTQQCVKGCFCKEGLVRSDGGECVKPDECPKDRCPKNEKFNECGSACPTTCSNRDEQQVCTAQCVSGCFCKEGLIRSDGGECVKPDECPKDKPTKTSCAKNGEWYTCVPDFRTCHNFRWGVWEEPTECREGCFCEEGLVLNDAGECVPLEDCLIPTCPAGELWTDCVNPCARCQCGEPCYFNSCDAGCDCTGGFVRNTDGICVHGDHCPSCVSKESESESSADGSQSESTADSAAAAQS